MYEAFLMVANFVNGFGYTGIFLMTFIESTFIPIPAEITLVPAGFLVSQGDMNFFLLWLVSTFGTLAGSLLNYWIAYHYGRRILLRFGKLFFINEKKLAKIEKFFYNHGAISTFTGRLLPGVKHFIAFPAGLARMNIKTFSIYTLCGGAIWCGILIYLGYIIGENHDLIKKNIKLVNLGLVCFVACLITSYVVYRKFQKKHINTNTKSGK